MARGSLRPLAGSAPGARRRLQLLRLVCLVSLVFFVNVANAFDLECAFHAKDAPCRWEIVNGFSRSSETGSGNKVLHAIRSAASLPPRLAQTSLTSKAL